MNERHHFLKQKSSVAIGATTAETRYARRRVLPEPRLPGIVNSDDDKRLDATAVNFAVRRRAHVPVLSVERGCTIEKILTIMQIEDGKAPQRLFLISGRQIHCEAALVAEEL